MLQIAKKLIERRYPTGWVVLLQFIHRCKVGNNITRVMYFFYFEGKIILTNGFVKKTQKTPKKEIDLAKARRKDFVERMDEK